METEQELMVNTRDSLLRELHERLGQYDTLMNEKGHAGDLVRNLRPKAFDRKINDFNIYSYN